jgi:hypothetical protein
MSFAAELEFPGLKKRSILVGDSMGWFEEKRLCRKDLMSSIAL